MLNSKKIITASKDVQQRGIQVTAPIVDIGLKESLSITHGKKSQSGEWEPKDQSLARGEKASSFRSCEQLMDSS